MKIITQISWFDDIRHKNLEGMGELAYLRVKILVCIFLGPYAIIAHGSKISSVFTFYRNEGIQWQIIQEKKSLF